MPGSRVLQPTRSASAGLFACGLLLLFAATTLGAANDRPVVIGDDPEAAYAMAAASGLFGRFRSSEDTYQGDFMRFEIDPETGSLFGIRFGDTALLDRIGPGVVGGRAEIVGPTTHFENTTNHITVHDNRYGWISYGARTMEATVHFPAGSEIEVVPDGLKATIGNETLRLYYDGPGQNNVSMEGTIAHIRPQSGYLNYTITLRAGIHGFDTRPGSWWLVAQSGDTMVADVLRPTNPQHVLLPREGSDLRLGLGPLSELDRRDAAHRIDSVGVLPEPPRVYALGPDDRLFNQAPGSTIFTGPRAAAWINVTTSSPQIATILLRQPFGLQGNVTLHRDSTPPAIHEVVLHNLTDFWSPDNRPPALSLQTDEPATATLHLTAAQHELTLNRTRPATRLSMSLADLQADTRYDWRLLVRDRAGNVNHTTGTLTTPLDANLLIPDIDIKHPRRDAHFAPGETVYLNATVTDGAGRILPDGHVRVFLDNRPVTQQISWEGPKLIVRLGILEDGPHTARVEASGYNPERVGKDLVQFTVGISASTPATGLLPLALLLVLMGVAWRHRHP